MFEDANILTHDSGDDQKCWGQKGLAGAAYRHTSARHLAALCVDVGACG